MRRGLHGINHDRCLLSLELIDCTDPATRYPILQVEYLSVVGRDNQNIIQSDSLLFSFSVNPGCLGSQNVPDHLFDGRPLLRRRVLIAAMFPRPISQTRALKLPRGANHLALESRNSRQSIFIEELGSKSTDLGMKSPRLPQEQPLFGPDCLTVIQDVIQRGDPGPVRVTPLRWLIELSGIAEQHKAGRRMRHRQNVGERHLGRLVHEEHIDALQRLRPRPKPGGPRRYITTAAQRTENVRVALGKKQIGLILLRFGSFLDAANRVAHFSGGGNYFVEQTPNDLM